jgi:hypothetical protein
MKFKIWLEDLQSDKVQQLQSIWSDVFRALGVDGESPEDNALKSLNRIKYGHSEAGGHNEFQGKKATLKRLENGQIFSRLQKLGDADINNQIEATKRWLGSSEGSADGKTNVNANADTTISKLLQNLFGPKYFQQFIGDDFPKMDQAVAQVQPQPPKDNTAPNTSLDQNTPQPPMPQDPSNPMAMQPQANGSQMPVPPSNPMPPKPAGAEMGLF